jgi:hypothetical protein
LPELRVVQATKAGAGAVANQHTEHVHKWQKSMSGRVKCNIDASFPISIYNRIGIAFVLEKSLVPMFWQSMSNSLWYANSLGPVDFEPDSKVVVDKFHSNKIYDTELGILCHIVNNFFLFVIITLLLSLSGDKQMKWLID